jgi:UDP-glucose 4-epimerase
VVRDRSIRLFGDGIERRDHLYIGDLVRLVARLIETDVVGVYNLASGVSHSFAQVAQCLRGIVPFEFAVSRMPRHGPVTHRTFNITRLSQQVPGFQFTDMEQALRETFEHLTAQLERV